MYKRAEAMLIIKSRLDVLEDGQLVLDPMILWAVRAVKPIAKRAGELYEVDGGARIDWYQIVREDVRISRMWGWENDKGCYALSFKP